MKHKKIEAVFSYGLCLALMCTGCAKVETTKTYTVTNTTAQTTIASDEVLINNEFDQAVDDAISVICNPKTAIPGAIIDTSQISIGVIEIDYFGKEADGTKSRTGSDSIHQNMVGGHILPWGTLGTSASVTFGDINDHAYEVLFSENGNSVTFSGSATLTNISGGLLQNISQADSLKTHIRGTIQFTYNDNATQIQYYPWSFNQLRTFIADTSVYAVTTGDTSISGFSNIGVWGTTRLSTTFYTVITSPVIQNITYSSLSYNPLSGTKTIEGIAEPISCQYGVNNAGIYQAGGKPYGFHITWTDNGIQANSTLPYYY